MLRAITIKFRVLTWTSGGEGGIRTLDAIAGIQSFQDCQFNHSCTSPGAHLSYSHVLNSSNDKADAPECVRLYLSGISTFRKMGSAERQCRTLRKKTSEHLWEGALRPGRIRFQTSASFVFPRTCPAPIRSSQAEDKL